MDCCSPNGLDEMFNESAAKKELKSYQKKGLTKRARTLVDFLTQQDISEATILEIGGGIGAVHLELMKAGAAKAVGVDVSSAYVKTATGLAESMGYGDLVEYHVGDFAEKEKDIPGAAIVLLDRVICCYPDMKTLVTASGRHAQRICALTYPRRTWPIRAGVSLTNFGMAILRRPFRVFVHRPQEVAATLASQGFSRVFEAYTGFGRIWEIAVYQRQ